jgi:integrase/recombinase XerD
VGWHGRLPVRKRRTICSPQQTFSSAAPGNLVLLWPGKPAQRQSMTNFDELPAMPSGAVDSPVDPLRLAVAAYLARFKGSSRDHTESDLRCYLSWCADHKLDPLAARRPHLELHIRWMQEVRRFKPSTVSRRFSVTAGFYRTCVIDGVLEHSPAEYVRRPSVPAESPHARVHAPAIRGPAYRRPSVQQRLRLRPGRHAWPAGLRIFEATGADIEDLGEEHGHRVLRVCGKGTKIVLVPLPPQ